MNRATVYAGANPRSQDTLSNARFAMTALSLLAQDLMGQTTQVFGAPVGPTTVPSMSVFVGAGRIYQMAPLEPSAWSSLAADSTPILKQGILTSTGITLACPAPLTSGQSINYLIEGQYQENDTNLVTLSYWNAANPSQPFSGAGNNGVAQPTVRAGQLIVQAVAGTAATTGSQTTPAVTSGWTAIAVVTVAQGATTIVSGNITQVAGNQQSGSFTLTGTGFSGTAPSGTCYYRCAGPLCTLMLPVLTGTSNANTFTAAGLPAFLIPANFSGSLNHTMPLAIAENNSAFIAGGYAVIQEGVASVNFGFLGNLGGWNASGTKSAGGNLSYLLS